MAKVTCAERYTDGAHFNSVTIVSADEKRPMIVNIMSHSFNGETNLYSVSGDVDAMYNILEEAGVSKEILASEDGDRLLANVANMLSKDCTKKNDYKQEPLRGADARGSVNIKDWDLRYSIRWLTIKAMDMARTIEE